MFEILCRLKKDTQSRTKISEYYGNIEEPKQQNFDKNIEKLLDSDRNFEDIIVILDLALNTCFAFDICH